MPTLCEDRIDLVLDDWSEERPDLSTKALGIVLRIQVLDKILADRLQGVLGGFGLEWWEYDVLSSLRRQGEPWRLTASEIAESSMLSPGALTNRIDRLMARGLVERMEDPADRRRVLVGLTGKGLHLIEGAIAARFRCAEECVEQLSPLEMEQLDRLLHRLLCQTEACEG